MIPKYCGIIQRLTANWLIGPAKITVGWYRNIVEVTKSLYKMTSQVWRNFSGWYENINQVTIQYSFYENTMGGTKIWWNDTEVIQVTIQYDSSAFMKIQWAIRKYGGMIQKLTKSQYKMTGQLLWKYSGRYEKNDTEVNQVTIQNDWSAFMKIQWAIR